MDAAQQDIRSGAGREQHRDTLRDTDEPQGDGYAALRRRRIDDGRSRVRRIGKPRLAAHPGEHAIRHAGEEVVEWRSGTNPDRLERPGRSSTSR